jgi:hypothetical protein
VWSYSLWKGILKYPVIIAFKLTNEVIGIVLLLLMAMSEMSQK